MDQTDKKYPIGGYAPGNYWCHCSSCGCKFTGDKRATQCEPCAIEGDNWFKSLSPEKQKEHLLKGVEELERLFQMEYRGTLHCKACADEQSGLKSIQAAKHTCRKNKSK